MEEKILKKEGGRYNVGDGGEEEDGGLPSTQREIRYWFQ